ncbi:hypothetical protein H7F28_16270 [Brevibacterium sp. PAMC23299]|nr:hypothetical protein H7F28_16270 [Brevibacterium sp. PAMC23299]
MSDEQEAIAWQFAAANRKRLKPTGITREFCQK